MQEMSELFHGGAGGVPTPGSGLLVDLSPHLRWWIYWSPVSTYGGQSIGGGYIGPQCPHMVDSPLVVDILVPSVHIWWAVYWWWIYWYQVSTHD